MFPGSPNLKSGFPNWANNNNEEHPPVRPIRHVQHASKWAERSTVVAPGYVVTSTTATVSREWSQFSSSSEVNWKRAPSVLLDLETLCPPVVNLPLPRDFCTTIAQSIPQASSSSATAGSRSNFWWLIPIVAILFYFLLFSRTRWSATFFISRPWLKLYLNRFVFEPAVHTD